MKQTNKFIFWLFTNPKAMKILMIYSTIIGIIIFSLLTALSIYLQWWWGSWLLFGILTILAVVKLIGTYKQLKVIDYTLGEFMDITAIHEEEKNSIKNNEVDEDGRDREKNDGEFEAAEPGSEFEYSEQGLSDDGESVGEKHQKVGRRFQKRKKKSESADISFIESVSEPEDDPRKPGDTKP